ncbi:MAG: DUF6569 family protein [Candidatus Cloacimonadaceae bacterium]|nr:DUF6569 family protein [Candidatus Cloacimonadaceae bacterium]
MKQALMDNLGAFYARECQSSGGLAILPILGKSAAQKEFLSLHQAMAQGTILISEVSQGGSVPNLKVVNRGRIPVLLLDGEELRGAKQNRVLNASVIVAAESELEIPVSCTESGRWHYNAPQFEESGNFVASSIKPGKMESVSQNLKMCASFKSDQGKVWDDIRSLHQTHNTCSATSAMADVYKERGKSLDEVCAAFPLLEGQCGIYVEIGGRFAGVDFVSHPKVWKDNHAKIIRSYAIDVVEPSLKPETIDQSKLDELFRGIMQSEVSWFKSVGLGEDIRVEQETLIGSALLWDKELVHFAAYPRQIRREREHYSSPRHRGGS